MKILVYGAGVLGSVHAAQLKELGQNVSILARSRRLADIRQYGIELENSPSGRRPITPINAVETFMSEDLASGASNGFQVCKCLLNSSGNVFRDLPTLGYTIVLDVFTYSRPGRKIALGDRLALGAAELFHEPLRHPVSSIHTSIEFIDSFIKSISSGCHSSYHSNDPRRAILDFARTQANSHYTGGKCAAGHAHEQSPAHES